MKKPDIQTSIEVERGDESFEVDVFGHFQKGERSWFSHAEGVGSPGYADSTEFDHAELDGKEFILTKEEEEEAQKALDKVVEDGDYLEEIDPPSDREPASYRDWDDDE